MVSKKILIVTGALIVILAPILSFYVIPYYGFYEFSMSNLNASANASTVVDCQSTDSRITVDTFLKSCSLTGRKDYLYKGYNVTEAYADCPIDFIGVTDDTNHIFINLNSTEYKFIVLAHEYCHIIYPQTINNSRITYISEGKDCSFVPLRDAIYEEERYCYEYELNPLNWDWIG